MKGLCLVLVLLPLLCWADLEACKQCATQQVVGGGACPVNEPRIKACTDELDGCYQCLLALVTGSSPPFSAACESNPLLKEVFECVVPPCPGCCPYEPFGIEACSAVYNTAFLEEQLGCYAGTCTAYDLDQSGQVDLLDVSITMDRWGTPLGAK